MSQPPQDPQADNQQPRYEAPPADAPQYAPQAPPPQYAPPTAPPQYNAPPPPQPSAPYYGQQSAQPGQPYALQFPAAPVGTLPGPGGYFDGATHPDDLHRPLYGAGFGQAIRRFFKQYAKFEGRASRSEFWWAALFTGMIYIGWIIIGAVLASAVDMGRYYASDPANAIAGFFAVIGFLWLLAVLIPSIAISWRRLHDANLAGPLYLLSLIPYVGWIPVLVLVLMPPKSEGRRFDRPRA